MRAASIAAAAAALLITAAPAGADQADRLREGTRQADREAQRAARQLSAYHERVGRCFRRSKATVCRYRFAGFDLTGDHYRCRMNVTVRDGQPPRQGIWRCR